MCVCCLCVCLFLWALLLVDPNLYTMQRRTGFQCLNDFKQLTVENLESERGKLFDWIY